MNSPYPAADEEKAILYRSFSAETKTLDTAILYVTGYVYDIVEPLFAYHLLKRPYELAPLVAESMPQPEIQRRLFEGKEFDAVVYSVRIRPGILYQSHPCFVESNHHLTPREVRVLRNVRDLKATGTRELVAGDFLLAVCRLADPRLGCPVYEIFDRNLLGLAEYRLRLETELARQRAQRKAAAGLLYGDEAKGTDK